MCGVGREIFYGIHHHTDNVNAKAAFTMLGGILIEVWDRDSQGVESSAIIKDFDNKRIVIVGANVNKKFFGVVELVGVADKIGARFVHSKGNFVDILLRKSKFTRFVLNELADAL